MTDKQTNKQTHILTFRLIERIGPEGQFFENTEFANQYCKPVPAGTIMRLDFGVDIMEIAFILFNDCQVKPLEID